MSSMGELTFFLRLLVKQKEDGIFISQDKYVAEILKKFDFASVKTASTPIETQKPLVKDKEASDVDVDLYRFLGHTKVFPFSAVKKKFLVTMLEQILTGNPQQEVVNSCRRLISCMQKAKTIVATSTTEAEYVAAASCCGQVLWIQNQMLDYGFNFMNTKIYIDNESTICIVKNPVYHSKTKHIAIRHHFIRDAYEKKLIQVLKIHTDDNVADLLQPRTFDLLASFIAFRGSLRRVNDGTEALLILPLFILWLDKVSTASAKLVPLGKVCTAIETLKKNTARALISLLTTISLSSTMAVLDSCPKHNMVAYLEKSEGNAEFHEIIDFLKRSSIHHALTVSPVVSTTFVEQFWTSAKSKTINNVRHITAKVAGKSVSISEASIRSDLLFDDADGIDSLPNQAIFDAIQLMGTDKEVVSTDKEKVSTDKEKVSTDRPIVSTDGSKIGTEEQVKGTDEQIKGTEWHNEGTEEHIEGTDEQFESTDGQRKVFGMMKTLAKVASNMSQPKLFQEKRRIRGCVKDIEEADRPRPTSKSLLDTKASSKD
ncbi:hypothetical protein Tco_0007095 [Tanacetum coccineum]